MKPKTQTTSSKTETKYPQWQQDALQGLVGTAGELTAPFLQTPSYATAGFTPDQLNAMQLARMSTANAYGGPTQIAQSVGYSPAQQSAAGYTGTGYTASGYNPAMASASSYQADLAKSEQTTGSDIERMINPYLRNVVDTTRKSAQRDLADTQASIGARAAASGSFGGSREALQRGRADEAYADRMNETVASLMAQGYDRATAIAQANTGLRQQTALANQAATNSELQNNASFEQQVELTNAGARNSASQFGANTRNTAAQYGADATNSANAFNASNEQDARTRNAGSLNRAAEFGLNNAQSYAQLQDALRSNDLNRQLQAMQILLGIGNQQQAQAQTNLDVPYTALSRYGQFVPQSLNSKGQGTQQQPSSGPSPFQTVLGAGASILGSFLSDENTKTNKQKLGKDPETGLDIYAYDYKDDVKAAKKAKAPMGPKRVGPMAQDVEKLIPGSTQKIGGNLAILLR